MERDFIAWLRKHVPAHANLQLGPGDDAAILGSGQRGDFVVTADLLADGVHFQLEVAGASRVGRKALAVNLSDLAAMAAQPHSAVVSFLLPTSDAKDLAIELYEGILPLADQYGLAIAGGDTNCWDGPLVISVTALGQTTPHGALLRSGARPGDVVVVTGSFGGSRLGHHYDFSPRIEEAIKLAADYEIHAAIDVSDGLSLDLSRICQESGCGALVDLSAVPISADAKHLAEQEAEVDAGLRRALQDGEDFELALAVPAKEAARLLAAQPLRIPLTQIGRFIPEPGLWQQDESGARRPLAVGGFEHGSKESW